MIVEELNLLSRTETLLARASIAKCLDTGEILVRTDDEPTVQVLCDVVITSADSAVSFADGDPVLVLLPKTQDEKGCILGRIGTCPRPDDGTQPDREHVVIDANEGLTLRCGQGSITLRKDGKILIQGLDIVSRAKRNLKIKGGSVHIN